MVITYVKRCEFTYEERDRIVDLIRKRIDTPYSIPRGELVELNAILAKLERG